MVQGGSRELIIVVEVASLYCLIIPLWIIYKRKGHYMGWHQNTNDPDIVFAYSDNG